MIKLYFTDKWRTKWEAAQEHIEKLLLLETVKTHAYPASDRFLIQTE